MQVISTDILESIRVQVEKMEPGTKFRYDHQTRIDRPHPKVLFILQSLRLEGVVELHLERSKTEKGRVYFVAVKR